MKCENMGDNPVFVKNLSATVEASQQFVKVVCQHAAGDHLPSKVTLAIACASGPLAAIALMTGKDNNHTPETFLFAALLMAKSIMPVDQSHTSLAMSPAVILEAMEAYEKLTGQKADDVICEGMASAAHDIESGSVVPLAEFLKARGAKLN